VVPDVKLFRPDLAIDVAHDNRHVLPLNPLARESIPYVLTLPDEQICAFTYTWVNGASEAGAAIAVFGPGVGDTPVMVRLPDRPVPADMDFADWRIDGFSMRQDLAFRDAQICCATDQVTIEFTFSAYHPPYAYGSHAEGCPAYTATDRIEQSGRINGQLVLRDRTINFRTMGHRDHSWGTRDWGVFQYYQWFVGQTEDNISVHFWSFLTYGRENFRGYVVRDGLMAEVTDVRSQVITDSGLVQKRLLATVTDEAGRVTEIDATFVGHTTLPADPRLSIREAGGRATFNGRPGYGWLDVAWPPSYLDYMTSKSRD